MMEALLGLVGLAVWIGVWVLVVKKRGKHGKLVSNLLGAVLGLVASMILIGTFAPGPTPEQIQAREEAAKVADEEKRLKAEAEAKAKAEAEKNKDRSIQAAIICSNFVEQSLKSPSSAEFPFGRAAGWARQMPDQNYLIRSYVDSQNGFGAMIRTWYVCGIQYAGGEPLRPSSWNLTKLEFEP